MRRGTPISFLFFFFFNYATYSCSAEEQRWTELEWPIHKNSKLSSHTRVYCGVCGAAGKTHTSLQITQWTHTSVSLSCSTPWYRVTRYKQTWVHCPLIQGEDAVDLQQYQCVFPLPALSHIRQEYMLMIDASHRPISRLSQTWLSCDWKIPFSKLCYMVTGEEGIVSDKGRCPDVTSQQPNR